MELRKCFLSVVLTLTSLVAHAQDISGVGEFKIGMPLEAFMQIPTIRAKNLQDRSNRTSKTADEDLWRTTSDSQVKPAERTYSSDIEKYEFRTQLGLSNVSGVDSHEILVFFYKRRLAKIHVFDIGGEFNEVLTAKYGEPAAEDGRKNTICRNNLGVAFEAKEGTIKYIWGGRKTHHWFH